MNSRRAAGLTFSPSKKKSRNKAILKGLLEISGCVSSLLLSSPPLCMYPSPTEREREVGIRMGDENDFCLHHHHLLLLLPIWQRLTSRGGAFIPFSQSLLCLRASQFRKCTINIWTLLDRSRSPSVVHPCQFLAQEMVPFRP